MWPSISHKHECICVYMNTYIHTPHTHKNLLKKYCNKIYLQLMNCLFLDFSILYFWTIFDDGPLKPHEDHRGGTATLVARSKPRFPTPFLYDLGLLRLLSSLVQNGMLDNGMPFLVYDHSRDPQGTPSVTMNKEEGDRRLPWSCSFTCSRRSNDRMQEWKATTETVDQSCFQTPRKLW